MVSLWPQKKHNEVALFTPKKWPSRFVFRSSEGKRKKSFSKCFSLSDNSWKYAYSKKYDKHEKKNHFDHWWLECRRHDDVLCDFSSSFTCVLCLFFWLFSFINPSNGFMVCMLFCESANRKYFLSEISQWREKCNVNRKYIRQLRVGFAMLLMSSLNVAKEES